MAVDRDPTVAPGRGADVGRLRRLVESMPAPRSRLHSPSSMAAMDDLVLSGFREAGWDAAIESFEFVDAAGYEDLGTLRRGRWGPVVYPRVSGANVIARRDGSGSSETLAIVAHHDTPRDLPGADDNSAAVAVLMELARILAGDRFAVRVVLAVVDMEEIGMFGSRALVDQLRPLGPIRGAITMDTIAYVDRRPGSQLLPPGIGLLYPGLVRSLRRRGMRGDWTGVIHRGSSRFLLDPIVEELRRRDGPAAAVALRDPGDLPLIGPPLRALLPMVRQFARSDHLSFWNAGIPAVVLTDTTFFRNPHYHEFTDLPESLDYERLASITDALAAAIRRLAGSAGYRDLAGRPG